MIYIINYGMGNVGSVFNMLKRIGYLSTIVESPEELKDAEKIILPGVGSFDAAVQRLHELSFWDILLRKATIEKIPILGICLGMQLLTRGSEEGKLPGLGLIKADTIRFPNEKGLKIPHMGWNLVYPVSPSPITKDLPDETRFYFVHSYYVKVDNETESVLKCKYGIEFDAAIQHENIFGVQFHPEKSHKFGMKVLENFAKL
jgi:glutamine amidotransferase